MPNTDIISILKDANHYARSILIKGSTQLENNSLSKESFQFLSKGVFDVRALQDDANQSMYQEIKNKLVFDEKEKRFKDDINHLISYEEYVAITKKYSLGNCSELVVQAFDYILNHADPAVIKAEMFTLCGKREEDHGDHVFLVINRSNKSISLFPDTWGPDAMICDPWANKIYPASDYLNQLGSYYYKDGKNFVESFDPSRHQVGHSFFNMYPMILDTCDTSIFSLVRKAMGRVLNNTYCKVILPEVTSVLEILQQLQSDLCQMKLMLTNSHHQLIKTIDERILILQEAKNNLKKLVEKKDFFLLTTPEKLEELSLIQKQSIKIFNQTIQSASQGLFKKPNISARFLSFFGRDDHTIELEWQKMKDKINANIKSKLK